MWYTSSCGRIELQLTKAQAQSCSHTGPCDAEVKSLSIVPAVRRQLEAIDPKLLAAELKEYGAWSNEELADHDQNLQRLVWVAAGEITEGRP